MFCTRCGLEMQTADKYCAQCGTLAGAAANTADSAPPLPHSAIPFISPQLTRSLRNRKIAGVCGGIARYFEVDATIVRVLFVALFFCPVLPSIIPYLVCWIVMPLEQPAPVAATPTSPIAYPPASGYSSYSPVPR